MKKLALMIVAMILASTIAAIADTSFDPSQYSVEELSEIQDIISNYLSQNKNNAEDSGKTVLDIQDIISNYLSQNKNNAEDGGKTVLYNENGIYVEFRGIEKHSWDSLIVNLYIENNYGDEITVHLNNVLVNHFTVNIGNNFPTISDGSAYLSKPNFDFVIDNEDLKDYEISVIETLNFNLEIKKGNGTSDDVIVEMPIALEIL